MQVTHLPYHIFLIFTGAVVFSVLVQAAVFVGLYMTVRRATTKMLQLATQLSKQAGPIVEQVGGIIKDSEPKIRTVTSQVVEITTAVRDQTIHVNETVDEVVDKTHAQVDKVDEMVSAVLGGIANAGAVVQSGVIRPVRKLGGILQGVRVGVETFFSNGNASHPPAAYTAQTHRPAGPVSVEEYDVEPPVEVDEVVPVVSDPRRTVKFVAQDANAKIPVEVRDDLPPMPPHPETAK